MSLVSLQGELISTCARAPPPLPWTIVGHYSPDTVHPLAEI